MCSYIMMYNLIHNKRAHDAKFVVTWPSSTPSRFCSLNRFRKQKSSRVFWFGRGGMTSGP